jgi:hypothetical protein
MTDLDLLEKRVAALVRKVDTAVAKARHRVIVEHDDGNGDDGDGDYEDVSNPSLDAADDDEDGNGNPGNDLDDENGEDEDDDDDEKDVDHRLDSMHRAIWRLAVGDCGQVEL